MEESHLNRSNLPIGVMDFDSDLTAVNPADCTYALNIRNGYGSILNAAKNVKGNELITFPLPAGTNKNIGSFEDLRGESLVYFIYNSGGNHLILRYFPNSTATPGGEIVQVAIGSAFNFNPDWLITHACLIAGKLLYWTDAYTDKQSIEGNPPRVINIERSRISGKKLTYNVYAGLPDQGQFADAVTDGTTLTFQFYDKATGAITAQTTTINSAVLLTLANDPDAILTYIASVINTIFPTIATAEFCDCKATIEVREDLTLTIVENNATLPSIIFVAGNHYPTPLQEWHIDLIKYPPIYEPIPTYQVNPDITYNNVNRSTFQFRVRYWYSENEKSAWGPISLVALNLEQDGRILDGMNEIEVDFTESRLNDPSFLAMIQSVEIAFRIGNDGIFRSIERKKTCEIGINKQFIIFINDKLYSAVESDDVVSDGGNQVLKLFDSVPRLTGAIENVADREGNSRMFAAANLENFDCPDCIEMEFEVTQEPGDECLVNITGTVFVDNIVFLASNTAVAGFVPANYPYEVSNPSATEFFSFEEMILEGFVVYLAGTNFFAISDNPNDGSGTGSFTISGVPKGRYILRVASHKCCFDNTNGNIHNLSSGLQWQKTSTYLYKIDGAEVKELELDLTTAVSGSTTDIGDLRIVSDKSPNVNRGSFVPPDPRAGDYYSVFPMYLRDNNGENDADPTIEYSIRRGAISVELQQIKLLKPPFFGGEVPVYYENGAITDHNGYAFVFFWNDFSTSTDIANTYWIAENVAFRGVAQDVCNAPGTISLTLTSYAGYFADALKGLEDGNLPNISPLVTPPNYVSGILGVSNYVSFNGNKTFSEENKTRIEGQVLDANGMPKENMLLVFSQNGRQEKSATNGNYSITVYCPYNAVNRTGNLIATYLVDACYTYEITPNPQALIVGEFCADYTADIPFSVPDIAINLKTGILQVKRYLKRGASYNVGICYEDRANRKCSVSVAKNQLQIPYFNQIGAITKPLSAWQINHVPPEWATHYRIVRSLNSTYRRYLQWTIDTVRYVRIETPQDTPADTSYSNGDATHILIDLGSVTNADTNTNPILFFFNNRADGAYEAEPLDRIRFITDETAAVFSQLLEYEVEGRYIENDKYYLVIKDPELFQEIKGGWLIEVYSPKRNQEVFYYECGETYPIINPGTPGRTHGGQTQNQIIGVQPAAGYFIGGDTYWRLEDFSVDDANSINVLLEHDFISSRFVSKVEDIGRINVQDDNLKEFFYYNNIRFSEIFLQGTQVNGLSSWRAIDVQGIDQRWGIIKKLVLADMVMLAIAQNKVQPIYVSKDLLLNLSGASDVGRSDKIVNLAEPLKYDYGTNNPESVVEENGTVYGWDVAKGVVWRYSVNGLFPISEYKAITFFDDLGRRLYKQPRKNTRAFGGFERSFQTYLLTFAADGVELLQPFTISFDEKKNGWNNFLSFTPENYGNIGRKMASFVNGQLWLHESGNVPMNNFYGVQYTSRWRMVFNHGPKAVKLLWNIELQGDNLWICSDIRIPPNNDYAQGMFSRLKANYWSRTEGVWKADFLRDINDTSARFLNILNPALRELSALLYGRPLRGEVAEITLELADGSKESILRRIDVEHNLSMDTKV